MSWVIVRKNDGKAVLETWNPRVAGAINRAVYDVVPAWKYLATLNARIKEGSTCPTH